MWQKAPIFYKKSGFIYKRRKDFEKNRIFLTTPDLKESGRKSVKQAFL